MAWLTYLDVLCFGSTILFWLLDIINSMFAEIDSNFTEQHLRVLKCLSVCLPVYKLHVWYPQRFVRMDGGTGMYKLALNRDYCLDKNQLHQVISSQPASIDLLVCLNLLCIMPQTTLGFLFWQKPN